MTSPTAAQIAGARSWKSENIGDEVSGTVLGFDVYEHPEFGKSPVVVVDTADGTDSPVRRIFVLGVLLTQFKGFGGLTVGDRYTVIYLGDEEGKRKDSKGNPISYHNYASYKGDAPELADTLDMSLFD
jgi:hypothetical protein